MSSARPSLLEGYELFRRHVNPLSVTRAEITGEPYRVVAVREGRLVDADGREVDDFLSGWGTQAFGHRNPEIGRALREFLAGGSPSYFTSVISPYAGMLAARLAERTGGALDRAFFVSGGSEAVEAALKLARASTGRPRILCLERGYHGYTMGGVSMMHPGTYRDAFGPHLPAVDRLPFGDLAALESALALPDVAALVVEPIQIEGGVRALPPEYVRVLCEETRRHGVLLVADEIQTGLGRTGRFLASDAWPRRPDVVVLGKALGGGLMPASAMLTRAEIFDRAYGTHPTAESHASTFSGNAMACVAALAFLELLTDDVLQRVRERGAELHRALREALGGLPLVEEIRGEGLLAGVALRAADHPWLTFEYLGMPEYSERSAVGLLTCHRLYKAGFLVNVCGHDWSVLRLQPPLDTGSERLAAFVHACRDAVEYLCQLR